jgi:hypothetical protein
MYFLVIEQSPGRYKPPGSDYDQGYSDQDESCLIVTAKRKSLSTFSPASGVFAPAVVSTATLNFSMTNPNPVTAMPVRTQARNVRSLAAWSLKPRIKTPR